MELESPTNFDRSKIDLDDGGREPIKKIDTFLAGQQDDYDGEAMAHVDLNVLSRQKSRFQREKEEEMDEL
jgi:hypothetical protein